MQSPFCRLRSVLRGFRLVWFCQTAWVQRSRSTADKAIPQATSDTCHAVLDVRPAAFKLLFQPVCLTPPRTGHVGPSCLTSLPAFVLETFDSGSP
ncbi:hypothetical protein HDV57DRAFT_435371 [Trichoderma longibrachiatum]